MAFSVTAALELNHLAFIPTALVLSHFCPHPLHINLVARFFLVRLHTNKRPLAAPTDHIFCLRICQGTVPALRAFLPVIISKKRHLAVTGKWSASYALLPAKTVLQC
jgi:hypothetical protein